MGEFGAWLIATWGMPRPFGISVFLVLVGFGLIGAVLGDLLAAYVRHKPSHVVKLLFACTLLYAAYLLR